MNDGKRICVLLLCAGLLMTVFSGCGKKAQRSAMLMDLEAAPAEAEPKPARINEPMPLPFEPFPRAEPDQPLSSSMIADIEPQRRKAVAFLEKEMTEPMPIPEEPAPGKDKE